MSLNKRMKSIMRYDMSEKTEILFTIIFAVAIEMMNDLFFCQLPSNHIFHPLSMKQTLTIPDIFWASFATT